MSRDLISQPISQVTVTITERVARGDQAGVQTLLAEVTSAAESAAGGSTRGIVGVRNRLARIHRALPELEGSLGAQVTEVFRGVDRQLDRARTRGVARAQRARAAR